MVLAMSLIPLGDTAGKLMTQIGVAPFFIAWARFALGGLMLLPVRRAKVWEDLKLLGNWRVWLRGLLIVAGISSILTALRTEPIALVFGAFFVGPMISYLLSALFLGERLTLWRSLMMIIGFGGVLLVVKPGFGMTPGLPFAVMAGVFYGAYLVTNRWLAGDMNPTALLLSQLVIGALVLAPVGVFLVPGLDGQIILLLALSAGASMLGNLLLLRAYQSAQATVLAPLVYFQLIAATLFGVLFFDDIPDGYAFLGMALLIVSGVLSLRDRTQG